MARLVIAFLTYLWIATTLPASAQRIRLMAANLTSGTNQAYEDPGIRIFQGVKPDIVMLQEFNYGNNTPASLRAFVDAAFGTSFNYFRETGATIPNGVISRYPILQSGEWDDPRLTDRDFVWARIDVPGSRDLWAISVHLKANSTSATDRETQATNLKNFITAKSIPATDFLAIGGDFNSYSHTEPLFAQLSTVVNVSAPYPADAAGDVDTTAGRSSPYDGVYVDSDLVSIQIPVVIGASAFPNGLVVDTRVYTPSADLSPAVAGDSGASGMQHMGVVKDFMIPLPPDPPVIPLVSTQSNLAQPATIVITFRSTSGALYEVQSSSTMAPGGWTMLGQITAPGTTSSVSIVTTAPGIMQVRDSQLGMGQRKFYRIVRK